MKKNLKPDDYKILDDNNFVRAHGLIFTRQSPDGFVKRPLDAYYIYAFAQKGHGRRGKEKLVLFSRKSAVSLAKKGKDKFIPIVIDPRDSEKVKAFIEMSMKNIDTDSSKSNASDTKKNVPNRNTETLNYGKIKPKEYKLFRLRSKNRSVLGEFDTKSYARTINDLTGDKPLHVAIRTGDAKFVKNILKNMYRKKALNPISLTTRRVLGQSRSLRGKSPFHVSLESRGPQQFVMRSILEFPNENVHAMMKRMALMSYAGRTALNNATNRGNAPAIRLLRQVAPIPPTTTKLTSFSSQSRR